MLRLFFVIALSFSSLPIYAYNFFEKALTAYQSGEIEQAYIYLKNALQENDEDIASKVLMGQVLLQKGLYSDSIQEFEEVTLLGADQNQYLFDQARAMLLIGRDRQIIDLLDFNQLRVSEAVEAQTLLIKSSAYLNLDDKVSALAAIERANVIQPDNVNVLSSLANYYVINRLFSDANQIIQHLTSLAPDNARVSHLTGEYYAAIGDDKKAQAFFKEAYSLAPDDPIIMRTLAHSLTVSRDHKGALDLINKVIALTPNDPYARLLKSRLLYRQNELADAQQILQDISAKLSLLTDVQKNNNTSLAYIAGSSAYMQGNLELAQKELVFYVNANPNDLAGLNLLSEVYEQLGQPEKIEDLLERHQKVVFGNLGLSIKLFNIYLVSGKVYKARAILDELEQVYPEHLRVATARANFFAKAERFDEALQVLESQPTGKNTADYVLNKGLIYLEMGDFQNAIKSAEKLIELAPGNNEFKSFKAVIYLKSGQVQEAANIFSDIYSKSPENFSNAFNLANAYAKLGQQEKALLLIKKLNEQGNYQKQLLLLKAKLLRETRKTQEAIDVVQQILKRENQNQEALELLLSLYFEKQDYEQALNTVDRLSDIEFLSPRHLIYRANILIALNRVEESRRPIGVLLGLAESADDFYRVSLLQTKSGDYNGAYSTLEKALAIAPESKALQLEKLKLSIKIKPLEESQKYLSELARKYTNYAELSLLQGEIWQQKGDLTKAQDWYKKSLLQNNVFDAAAVRLYGLANQGIKVEHFTQTLEMVLSQDSGTLLMRNLLADYYLNTGDFQLAKKHYEQIADKSLPNRANILNNLANIYVDSDLAKAREYINKAIELAPNSSSIIDTKAWIMVQEGKLEQALTQLRKAHTLNSDNPVISYHLGYTLNALNRRSEAITELKRALDNKRSFRERETAQALLRSISETL